MRMNFDGVALDVRDEGSGPAMVLVHGLLLSKETWNAQIAALSRDARVVAIDLRGHGGSSVPPGPYLVETLASDVSDVLDALRIERATIVGHSLGGYVAFAFFRLFAERCAALGFVATHAAADEPALASERRALADRIDLEGLAPMLAAYVPRYLAPGSERERPDLYEGVERIAARTPAAGAAATLRGIAERVPSDDLFAEIAIPVRVVAGERDALVPIDLATRPAREIAGARLDVLPCGHMPQMEMPEAVSAALRELLDDAERA